MSMGPMRPKPEGATTVFVLGLLGLLLCQILGIIAWVQGNCKGRTESVAPGGRKT